MTKTFRQEIKLFYCYAREDKALRDELEKHLSNLKHQHCLTNWHDQEILAGENWEQAIDIHLSTSHLVFLLISPDFMASDYCYSKEMQKALDRHNSGNCRVLPILIRPVDCEDAPFSKLQFLPTGGEPITVWANHDLAFHNVTKGVRIAIKELLESLKAEEDRVIKEFGGFGVQVRMVAHEVENAATKTYEHMKQLVESVSTQVDQIESATLEVETMAVSSQQVAERAKRLYNNTVEAYKTVEEGRQATQQTFEGINRINSYVQETASKVQPLGEYSRKIENFVDIISNMAQQVNRLSLDAAIQSAMAGESGKGFRAVADDIRRLAEEAKSQANMLTRLVRSIREDISTAAISMNNTVHETSAGAILVQGAITSLQEIFSLVEEQRNEIEAINTMSQNQLKSSNNVTQIMGSVSNLAQQERDDTLITAQNMQNLVYISEKLLSSTSDLKIKNDNQNEKI